MQYTLYHGTNLTSANEILRSKEYKPCHKDIHYLGQGIYFYDKVYKAEKWIRVFHCGVGAILKNSVVVDKSKVLDLRNDKARVIASDIISSLDQNSILTGKVVNAAEYMKKMRCFLYDVISEETKCQLLISPVVTWTNLWQLGIEDKGDLQFCVKDSSIIKEISHYKNIGVIV